MASKTKTRTPAIPNSFTSGYVRRKAGRLSSWSTSSRPARTWIGVLLDLSDGGGSRCVSLLGGDVDISGGGGAVDSGNLEKRQNVPFKMHRQSVNQMGSVERIRRRLIFFLHVITKVQPLEVFNKTGCVPPIIRVFPHPQNWYYFLSRRA